MKFWLLEPISTEGNEWDPWYDCCFGMVVAANSEKQAREFASEEGAAEDWKPRSDKEAESVWSNSEKTSCTQLNKNTEAGVLVKDIMNA